MGDDNETLWLAHQQAREGNYRMALVNYESIIEDMEIDDSPENSSRLSYVPFQTEHRHGGSLDGMNSMIHGTGSRGNEFTDIGIKNIQKLISLAWHNKAVCLSRLGKTDEALVAAVHALKLDINNYKMIMNVAILLAEGQQFSEAEEAFAEALSTMTLSSSSSVLNDDDDYDDDGCDDGERNLDLLGRRCRCMIGRSACLLEMRLYSECETLLLSTTELLQASAYTVTTPQQEQERLQMKEILAEMLQTCRYYRRPNLTHHNPHYKPHHHPSQSQSQSLSQSQSYSHVNRSSHNPPNSMTSMSMTTTTTHTHDRLTPLVKRLFEIHPSNSHTRPPPLSSPRMKSSKTLSPSLPPKSLIESSRFVQWISTIRHDQLQQKQQQQSSPQPQQSPPQPQPQQPQLRQLHQPPQSDKGYLGAQRHEDKGYQGNTGKEDNAYQRFIKASSLSSQRVNPSFTGERNNNNNSNSNNNSNNIQSTGVIDMPLPLSIHVPSSSPPPLPPRALSSTEPGVWGGTEVETRRTGSASERVSGSRTEMKITTVLTSCPSPQRLSNTPTNPSPSTLSQPSLGAHSKTIHPSNTTHPVNTTYPSIAHRIAPRGNIHPQAASPWSPAPATTTTVTSMMQHSHSHSFNHTPHVGTSHTGQGLGLGLGPGPGPGQGQGQGLGLGPSGHGSSGLGMALSVPTQASPAPRPAVSNSLRCSYMSTSSPRQSLNIHSSIDITSSSSLHVHAHETSSHIGYHNVEEAHGPGPGSSPGHHHGSGASSIKWSMKGVSDHQGLIFNEEGLAPVETPAATQHLSQALLHPSNHHNLNHHHQRNHPPHHSQPHVSLDHERAQYGSPTAPRQGLSLAPALLLPLPHLTDEQFEAYFKVVKRQGLAS